MSVEDVATVFSQSEKLRPNPGALPDVEGQIRGQAASSLLRMHFRFECKHLPRFLQLQTTWMHKCPRGLET
jgi:hypothetical protein